MASRNERRKAAQLRLAAKSARIAKASKANDLTQVNDVTLKNANAPSERNTRKVKTKVGTLDGKSVYEVTKVRPNAETFYPSSILGRLGNTAPRFKSSGRGTGAMSSRAAQSLKARGRY